MNAEDPNGLYAKLSPNDPFDLWVLLTNTQYAVARSRDMELASCDIAREHAAILKTLQYSGGEATMTEIASFTMHRHHSVSNLIKKISAQGLVEKVKRPGSKEFAIVLTEKGRQLCNRTPKASVDMIFDILSQEDRRELAQLLKRILSKARSLMGVDYKPPFLR